MSETDREKAQEHERQVRDVAELAALEADAAPADAAVPGRLAELLADDRKLVRRAAARALTVLLDRGRVRAEAVVPLLEHAERRTRWGAAYALCKAGHDDPRVADIALESLGDEDGDLRWAAAAILAPQVKTDASLLGRLREQARAAEPVRRKMALLCLSDAGAERAGFYCDAARDDDSYVRLAAITALGRLGARDAGTFAALAALAESDPEATVRRAAAAVLARLQAGGAERR